MVRTAIDINAKSESWNMDQLKEEGGYYPPPSELFPGLFQRVALEEIFPAPKQWADAQWKVDPSVIRERFATEVPRPRAELREFVLRHFEVPEEAHRDEHREGSAPPDIGLIEKINETWDLLVKSGYGASLQDSIVPLPRPYVVPGGRFREMYYWDSFFTLLGMGSRQEEVSGWVAENIAWMIRRFGFMPNGNRTYYLGRSQPPFFFKIVELSNSTDRVAALANFLPELETEYAFWTREPRAIKLQGALGLSRYYDEIHRPRDESFVLDHASAKGSPFSEEQHYLDIRAATESGWDFSSRWLKDGQGLESIRTTSILPVDLNSILFGLEKALEQACAYTQDHAKAGYFRDRAQARAKLIDSYFWSCDAECYFDFDLEKGRNSDKLTAAVVYPLYFGCASAAQAAAVATRLEADLLRNGGLDTSTCQSGEQWDSPNGWAPLQWMAVQGLERYGFSRLAREIATRWVQMVDATFQSTGRLVEKYDVVNCVAGGGGEYPVQDGFGWTNGVTMALIEYLESPGHVVR